MRKTAWLLLAWLALGACQAPSEPAGPADSGFVTEYLTPVRVVCTQGASYHNDFFCDFPNESPADQLMVDSIQELLDAGALQIDIELYCAAAKFHFDEAKDLLEKGGNPAAWLPDKDFSGFQLDNHVGTESSYLCSLLQDIIVTECKADKVYYQDVKDLLGWAAFETMYAWIEKYRKHPHYKYPEIEE